MITFPKKYQPNFYPLTEKQIAFHNNLINNTHNFKHEGKQIKINFVDKENFMLTVRNAKNSIKLLSHYTDNYNALCHLIEECIYVIEITEKIDIKSS